MTLAGFPILVFSLWLGWLPAFGRLPSSITYEPITNFVLIDAILQLDRPVVVAYLMIIVLFFVLINLIVDILYSILDPRVRLQDQGA